MQQQEESCLKLWVGGHVARSDIPAAVAGCAAEAEQVVGVAGYHPRLAALPEAELRRKQQQFCLSLQDDHSCKWSCKRPQQLSTCVSA